MNLITTQIKWTIDRQKFLLPMQSQQLVSYCKIASEYDDTLNRSNMVVGWMAVHIGLSAGLRVAEIANLRCGDCFVMCGQNHMVVRNGKGGKRGEVILGKELKRHLTEFLAGKKARGEDVSANAYLLLSKRGSSFTTRGLQKKFKTIMRSADLPECYSIHSLRHSFGVELLRQTKNLRLVQKQMRHSSVTTTTVYADVQSEEIQYAMDSMN